MITKIHSAKQKSVTKKLFFCNICNREFDNIHSLASHRNWHDKTYREKNTKPKSKECKERMSKAHLGKHLSKETKKKLSKAHLGKKYNIKKIPCFCDICNREFDSKISLSNHKKWHDKTYREKIKVIRTGENNPRWKGDNARYRAIHNWMRKNKAKPEFCEHCGKFPPVEVANIKVKNVSEKYSRDINDYIWLCKKCHNHFDEIWDKAKITLKLKGRRK